MALVLAAALSSWATAASSPSRRASRRPGDRRGVALSRRRAVDRAGAALPIFLEKISAGTSNAATTIGPCGCGGFWSVRGLRLLSTGRPSGPRRGSGGRWSLLACSLVRVDGVGTGAGTRAFCFFLSYSRYPGAKIKRML